MVTTAAAVSSGRWCGTEVEALQLEYNWIKEFDPRFNVRYRDDKTYPVLAVTLDEEYPRLQVDARARAARACATSGRTPTPGPSARRSTCCCGSSRPAPARAGVFQRARPDRPALPARLHRQVLGAVRRPGHRRGAPRDRRRLLRLHGRPHRPADPAAGAGDGGRGRPSWSSRRPPGCATTSARCAGRWRSRPSCSATAPTPTSSPSPRTSCEAAVQVFHVRGGRVRGQRGWIVDKVEADRRHRRAGRAVPRCSSTASGRARRVGDDAGQPVPREILVPELPAGRRRADAEWLLAELRGSRVSLRVPQRGDKRALAETVERNAKEALRPSTGCSRASDLTARSAALQRARRTRSGWTARRCASSASTSRTCRAPTWWRRWWSSRTGWPSKSTTAGSRSADGARATTSPRSPRSSAALPPAPARDRGGGRRPTGTRRPGPARRGHRAGDRPPRRRPAARRHRPDDRPAAPVRLPAATCSSSTAAPRRSTRPRDVLAELGVVDVTVCGLAKRLEEVWLPGEDGPGDPPAHQRGAVPAAAGARRGAPVRHHLPPARSAPRRMTVSALDDVPGLGEVAAQGAAQALRIGPRAAGRRRRGDHRGARGRRRTRRPCRRSSPRRRPAGAAPTPIPAPRRPTAPPARDRDGPRPGAGRTAEVGRVASSDATSESGRADRGAGRPASTVDASDPGGVVSGLSGAAARRPSAWRTSAGSSSTTCRRS